ncbi:DUF2950 domain-containing protein [Paraburkholderia saeva]|uniref:DUF2950 domain-containing protein n=1 Tax=Paraburkholderia saeva TaxID=2777537 RepID=A0A9N8RXH7_9BURK|nr:DUF2950 domain-containing protein [Paraburkholderia saeva]CAG4892729.1 hypothetical protein R70241_01417 [Paraburkholderia saeva]CAG4898642.1 hypothetical protein LMG31841_02650 [Paraburkholderia saeva]CAG4900230.1 hypothetical protein R52603_02713 [Paraburkholderia saeva]
MIRLPARGTWRAHAIASALAFGTTSTMLMAPLLLLGTTSAHAQAVYPTPDAAANAFVDALARNDHAGLQHVLGNDYPHFIPTESIGQDDIVEFLGAWAKEHQIVTDAAPHNGRATAHLAVGTDGWTLPIPLEQTSKGWRFNPPAARDEILTRRIGRNERSAMLTSLAYIDAQNDYHNVTQHFAQKFVSSPGKRDGLYWDSAPGEPESPLGPLAATMSHGINPDEAYHGYHYRILTAQGSHAKGGAQNYVEGGELNKGFGLIAWPAQYGKTGVMSFIVNQDGQLYEKNLGPQTPRAVMAVKSFDPDSSWQATQP